MSDADLLEILGKQYRAALKMLSQSVSSCPESLWVAAEYPNRFWHIAYHAVFFTHFYLEPSEADFKPWEKAKENLQFLGAITLPPHERPKIETPYSKAEILEYIDFCLSGLSERLHRSELQSPSGFSWLKFTRMELHFYNLRHLQHHAGQLIDRLSTAANIHTNWVGAL